MKMFDLTINYADDPNGNVKKSVTEYGLSGYVGDEMARAIKGYSISCDKGSVKILLEDQLMEINIGWSQPTRNDFDTNM